MNDSFRELIERQIDAYGLPAMLEEVAIVCDDIANDLKYPDGPYTPGVARTEPERLVRAKTWTKAAEAVQEVANSTYNTSPPVTVGERGVW
jgi:hypothetical protein